MDWPRDAERWPNREASRIVRCRPHLWHVQEAGTGPTILLLHGAGGASQSWRGVFPLLARAHRVVAPDLPGQGFTRRGSRQRSGLRPTAEDLWTLCDHEGWSPDLIVAHSAGAALALQMELLRPGVPGIVGINAALGTFDGLAGWLFPAMAKMLSVTPFVPTLFARLSGNEARVKELLTATGSRIDAEGVRLYRQLTADADHVDGTLAMMAQWRIEPLLKDLPKVNCPVLLLAADRDSTVNPKVSQSAVARMSRARFRALPGLGHLAHEEDPALFAETAAVFLRQILADRADIASAATSDPAD